MDGAEVTSVSGSVRLSREEVHGVLRYWRTSLQFEEVFTSRSKPRAPVHGPSVPNLVSPSSGHSYCKLPLEHAATVLVGEQLAQPFDAEFCAFFEHWLSGAYGAREVSHLLSFPVIHLGRELAGLLRCPVKLSFGEPGQPPFAVPTGKERRQHKYPGPPSELRLAFAAPGEGRLPFFVDTRLLQHHLGVSRERIDETFEALRAEPTPDVQWMMRVICELLESELRRFADASRNGGGDEESLPARLYNASAGLLAAHGRRARAYPLALVSECARSKATYHLQSDLDALLDEKSKGVERDTCLAAYVGNDAAPLGRAETLGLFPGNPLSASQRVAAETCAGSRLTAVQGPPGTGKTTMIVHLCAAGLVRQVETLLASGAMGADLIVISSTNNRAVDNVIDGFVDPSESALPLALRVGSQQACEHVLLPVLERAQERLAMAGQIPRASRQQALSAALRRFSDLLREVHEVLGVRGEALTRIGERAHFQAELGSLQRECDAEGSQEGEFPALAPEILSRARARLLTMAGLTKTEPTARALQTLELEYRKLSKAVLPRISEILGTEDVVLKSPLAGTPPKQALEGWGAGIKAVLQAVEAAERVHTAREARRERVRQLEADLARTRVASDEVPGYDSAHDELQRGLFAAAVQVRNSWIIAESEPLLDAITDAVKVVRRDRSMRRLSADSNRRVRQMFGVWGCTLLSIGNCVPSSPDAISLLVIDEAGQCHPAYAVSGLKRAQRALVIGDTHQLEPVIALEPEDDERVIKASGVTLDRVKLAPYRVHRVSRTSVQSLADRAVPQRLRLTEHFRCQPEIIQICDRLCNYGLEILTPPAETPVVDLPFLAHSVAMLDIVGKQERLGGSWCNRAELEQVIELLGLLVRHGVEPRDLAVITPYRGQLDLLRKRCAQSGFPAGCSDDSAAGVAIGTVHRFQGGERSVVLFSSVVTSEDTLGFLDDQPNLLNVAISRAKHRFILVGHAAVLAQGRRTGLLTRAAFRTGAIDRHLCTRPI